MLLEASPTFMDKMKLFGTSTAKAETVTYDLPVDFAVVFERLLHVINHEEIPEFGAFSDFDLRTVAALLDIY